MFTRRKRVEKEETTKESVLEERLDAANDMVNRLRLGNDHEALAISQSIHTMSNSSLTAEFEKMSEADLKALENIMGEDKKKDQVS